MWGGRLHHLTIGVAYCNRGFDHCSNGGGSRVLRMVMMVVVVRTALTSCAAKQDSVLQNDDGGKSDVSFIILENMTTETMGMVMVVMIIGVAICTIDSTCDDDGGGYDYTKPSSVKYPFGWTSRVTITK